MIPLGLAVGLLYVVVAASIGRACVPGVHAGRMRWWHLGAGAALWPLVIVYEATVHPWRWIALAFYCGSAVLVALSVRARRLELFLGGVAGSLWGIGERLERRT